MKNFLIIILLLVLLGGAAFGTLAYLGIIHHAAPAVARQVSKPPAGAAAVPLSFRRIPAYRRVTRDDLLNPKTGKPEIVYLQPESGPNRPLAKASEILGRVLRHDKEPGYIFYESDFFPLGTEPGDAAAIPPGKRAMTIDASKVSGVFSLLPGNHVDLVASQVIDNKGTKIPGWPVVSRDPAALPPGSVKQATFTVLVRNGVVITPVTERLSTYMGNGGGLMPEQQVKRKPVQEIMIAMDPEEVPKLTEALAANADITCFLRSGQPATTRSAQPSIPESFTTSQPAVRVVEKIVGKQHSFVYLPSAASQRDAADPAGAGAPAAKEAP